MYIGHVVTTTIAGRLDFWVESKIQYVGVVLPIDAALLSLHCADTNE